MKTVTIQGYTISELVKEGNKTAVQKIVDGITDYDTSNKLSMRYHEWVDFGVECTLDNEKLRLEELGFQDVKFKYDLRSYVDFSGDIYLSDVLEHIKFDKRKITKELKDFNPSFNVSNGNQVYLSKFSDMWIGEISIASEKVIDKLYKAIEDWYDDLCRELKNTVIGDYDSYFEDETVIGYLEDLSNCDDLELYFDSDGDLIKL